MKNYDYIFFDLDGTLDDSAQGIVNSVNYAFFGWVYLSAAFMSFKNLLVRLFCSVLQGSLRLFSGRN